MIAAAARSDSAATSQAVISRASDLRELGLPGELLVEGRRGWDATSASPPPSRERNRPRGPSPAALSSARFACFFAARCSFCSDTLTLASV